MEPLIGTETNNNCGLSKYWITACSLWVETIQRLCLNFDYSDSPWEYLERTNSAIFAGALSASGLPSMPETYVMRDGQKVQQNQRVDICSVDSGKSVELIEFKMAEYNAAYPQTIQKIASKLKQATLQVNTITGIHGKELVNSDLIVRRTAAVIGLPLFEPQTGITAREDAMQKLITDLRNSPYDVKAWVFLPEHIATPSRRYKNHYPGIFLVAKPA